MSMGMALHRDEVTNMGTPGITLDGWEEITTHVEVLTGITRSQRTVRRWAAMRHDPLPVTRTPGGRDVIADSLELEAWWTRNKQRWDVVVDA